MSSEDEDQQVAIGISFGNSYSSIACIQGGDAQVIANEEGDRQIPTVLSYVGGEEFQGTQAKSQLVRNASNTCAGFRDYLGKKCVFHVPKLRKIRSARDSDTDHAVCQQL